MLSMEAEVKVVFPNFFAVYLLLFAFLLLLATICTCTGKRTVY